MLIHFYNWKEKYFTTADCYMRDVEGINEQLIYEWWLRQPKKSRKSITPTSQVKSNRTII